MEFTCNYLNLNYFNIVIIVAGVRVDCEARRTKGGVPEGVHAGAAHGGDVPQVRGALGAGARPDTRRQQGAPRADACHTRHAARSREQGDTHHHITHVLPTQFLSLF